MCVHKLLCQNGGELLSWSPSVSAVLFLYLSQGLSQDLSCLSFGQVDYQKTPVRTGEDFYEDFSILTFGG